VKLIRTLGPSLLMPVGGLWMGIAINLKGWLLILFMVGLYMFGFGVAGMAANVADNDRRRDQ
jgi:hypothetical protein